MCSFSVVKRRTVKGCAVKGGEEAYCEEVHRERYPVNASRTRRERSPPVVLE